MFDLLKKQFNSFRLKKVLMDKGIKNYVVLYFKDNEKALCIVRNGKKYNRCYLLKLSFYDYSIVKSYVADGDFLILVTLIVSLVFLLKSDGISFFSDQYYRSQLTAKEAKNVINKNYNIVFYKKSCPYCKIAKKEILEKSKGSDITTFFADVETVSGKELVRKYRISKAPSIVAVRGDNLKVNLYAKDDEDGRMIVEKKVIKDSFR